MNYQKVYNQIIERAKTRQLEGYKEKHHVMPRCLGGTDDIDNLVELTAREHILCHRLLCFIYPKNKKLKWALYNMCRFKKYSTSREYEYARVQLSELKSKPILQYDLKGNFIKEWKSGKEAAHSNNFNPINICSCLNKKGKSAHGFVWVFKNGEIKLKIDIKEFKRKKHNKRSPNKSGSYGFKKKIIQLDKNNKELNKFDSMVDASEKTNIRPDSISACCRGIQKTAGGFVWRYDLSKFPIYTK